MKDHDHILIVAQLATLLVTGFLLGLTAGIETAERCARKITGKSLSELFRGNKKEAE